MQHHTTQRDLLLGHVHTASSQGGSSNSAAVAVHTACKRSLYVTYGQQHVHLLQIVQGLQRELKRAPAQTLHDQGKEASKYPSDLPSRQSSRLPATHPSSSTRPVTAHVSIRVSTSSASTSAPRSATGCKPSCILACARNARAASEEPD
jgi:hypothetical protein